MKFKKCVAYLLTFLIALCKTSDVDVGEQIKTNEESFSELITKSFEKIEGESKIINLEIRKMLIAMTKEMVSMKEYITKHDKLLDVVLKKPKNARYIGFGTPHYGDFVRPERGPMELSRCLKLCADAQRDDKSINGVVFVEKDGSCRCYQKESGHVVREGYVHYRLL